jgi:hypothetical protein
VKRSARQITSPRFVRQASGTTAKRPKEEAPDIEVSEAEKIPVPEEVPTAQSSDDEIREFLAWLSSLDIEGASEEAEMDGFDAEGNEVDYDREKSLVDSVIWEKWRKGYETYDTELYMSAIWEDDFFYTSDTGTPDDPSDDIILRGGQQEREAAARVNSLEYPRQNPNLRCFMLQETWLLFWSVEKIQKAYPNGAFLNGTTMHRTRYDRYCPYGSRDRTVEKQRQSSSL